MEYKEVESRSETERLGECGRKVSGCKVTKLYRIFQYRTIPCKT